MHGAHMGALGIFTHCMPCHSIVRRCSGHGPAGTIDIEEMMEFLQSMYGFRQKDSAAVRTIFKQLDRNNDKQIQAEEFVAGFNAYAVFAGVQ